jgi:hypothetical protein
MEDYGTGSSNSELQRVMKEKRNYIKEKFIFQN